MLIVEIKFSVYKQAYKQSLKSEDKSLCSAAGSTKKEILNIWFQIVVCVFLCNLQWYFEWLLLKE